MLGPHELCQPIPVAFGPVPIQATYFLLTFDISHMY